MLYRAAENRRVGADARKWWENDRQMKEPTL